jgi:HlyD family secretion protein
MKPQWKRVGYGVTAAVLIALLVYAFTPAALYVEVARAERGPLQVTVDEDGWTRARDRYVVTAPVTGRIGRIELRDGDPIVSDQVIAEIWPQPLGWATATESMRASSFGAPTMY